MTNRKIVLGLLGTYAGFVFSVTTLGSPAHLLGSALNFFSEPASIDRLAEFDDNGDSIPDIVNGPRIVEIFRSAAQVLGPVFGRSVYVPGMIRLDPAFFMPGSEPAGHGAAPATTEDGGASFDAVEPRWSLDKIRVSNEFEGGDLTPGMHLVPSTAISPSSSLPAFLTMPPVSSAAPVSSTPPVTSTPPSSTPPFSSMPPVSSAPPASTPPVMSASAMSTSASSVSTSMPTMPSSTMQTTGQSSSSMTMDCDFDGDDDDICTPVCQMYWMDKDGDGDKDPPTPPCS